jgi:glycosyltransferase involved in cell wall biosynthesis
MKISYAVTVVNEIKEIQTLLPLLIENKVEGDEIVVQYDNQNVTVEVLEYLNDLTFDKKIDKTIGYPLNGDFGTYKQHLTQNCTGDWIFQLDADETIDPILIQSLASILEGNPNIEMFFIPRINIVNGLTPEHIAKWRWQVNEQGWVNFPDVQGRLYQNKQSIFWAGKVHEQLQGFESYTIFPQDETYCIKHIKEIERQERQNALYETL